MRAWPCFRSISAVGLALGLVLGSTHAPASATTAAHASAPATIFTGEQAIITGDTGTRGRRPVRLELRAAKGWQIVSSGKTAADGSFKLRDRESRTGQYRVVAPRAVVKSVVLPSRVMRAGTVAWADALRSGQWLRAGQGLTSPAGTYKLVMQADGNLVEYGPNGAAWFTSTNGAAADLAMQADGNLVVYRRNGGPAVWSSSTHDFGGASLSVQDDGNLVIYQDGRALWDRYTGQRFNQLFGGQSLGIGQQLVSADHRYRVIMQGDGNLVEYQGANAVWSSSTGTPGATAIMQTDGNFVIYRPGGVALWHTQTGGKPGARLVLQNDANLVLYVGSTAIWSRHDGLIGGGPAGGGVIGDDYPTNLKSAAKDDIIDPWRFYNRECTSFVAWRINHQNGFDFSNFMRGGRFGDASNWANNARNIGFTVNSSPAVGSIAVSSGHVAWVARVGAGSVTIEEYNRNYNGVYGSRTVPTSSFSYIHVRDIG